MTLPAYAPPRELISGDSWQWDVPVGEHLPGDGWQLHYAIRGPTDLTLGATHIQAVGDTWQVRVPASATNLPPGNYRIAAYLLRGDERVTVYGAGPDEGDLLIHPNPASSVGALSHEEEMVLILRTQIARLANELTTAGRRGDREWRYQEIDRLRRLLGVYEAQVAWRRSGGRPGPSYEVIFRG